MYKAFLVLIFAVLMSGCTTGHWYVRTSLGELIPIKEPNFIDYKEDCAQLSDWDTTIHGAVYMVEKTHFSAPSELVSTRDFKRCPYNILKK